MVFILRPGNHLVLAKMRNEVEKCGVEQTWKKMDLEDVPENEY